MQKKIKKCKLLSLSSDQFTAYTIKIFPDLDILQLLMSPSIPHSFDETNPETQIGFFGIYFLHFNKKSLIQLLTRARWHFYFHLCNTNA